MKDETTTDTTRVLPCACVHAYQDAHYGRSLRLHNYAPRAMDKRGGWRCTVCRHERGA